VIEAGRELLGPGESFVTDLPTLEQVASEIEGRGEVIRGIAAILGGAFLLVVSSRAETFSVTQELENLKRLEVTNTISLIDFSRAKDALLAKLGK
jgi:hypothetical protein